MNNELNDKLNEIKFKNEHTYCDKTDVDFLISLVEKEMVMNKKLRSKCKELIKEKQILTAALEEK